MAKYELVEIAGEKRPVSFGMWALGSFLDETGMSLNDLGKLGEKADILTIVKLLWHGLSDGARKAKEKFEFSEQDVADWLDEDPEATERIMSVFGNTMPTESGKEKKAKARPGK